MTENFQPSEDIFDDVEGHGRRPGLDVGDVEGHGKRPPGLDASDADVEGHVVKFRG